MKDDPNQIADWLIDELGADAVKQAAGGVATVAVLQEAEFIAGAAAPWSADWYYLARRTMWRLRATI